MPGDSKPFVIPADDRTLISAITEERFAKYVERCTGDRTAALRLYTWNTAASAAFYGPLQAVEVTLRNAVNQKLGRALGQRWFERSPLMRANELRMANEAINTLKTRGTEPTPGRVVAELSLGFWTGLFANAYDQNLWRQHLHLIVTPRRRRPDLFDDLDRLRTLRNRIAHHEPIHQRDLKADNDRVVRVLTGFNVAMMAWVSHHSRIPAVLGTRPHDLTSF